MEKPPADISVLMTLMTQRGRQSSKKVTTESVFEVVTLQCRPVCLRNHSC